MSIQKAMNRRHAIKLLGDQTTSLSLAAGRIVMLKAFFVMLFVLVGIRASDVSLFAHRSDSAQKQSRQAHVGAKMRGNILDRNGVLLATTIETPSLYADPHFISDPQSAARQLVAIFPDISYEKLLKDLSGKKRFVWIKRGISPEQRRAVLHIGEPGLDFEEETKRYYPQGALASHLIGATDIDSKGIAGLERGFDSKLSLGQHVSLSVDTRLQHVLRREIKAAAETFKAIGGMGVIMNAKTGEVLAGVSWPDFKPNHMREASSGARFNRLMTGTYEFGSVFKTFSTAAFLENYDVPLSTTFDASEPIKSGRFTIRDYHAEDRVLTIPEVFMYSSNIGSAMMGQAVGNERLKKFYDDLGLLTRLDMGTMETAKPQVPKQWGDISTLTTSYGHGIAVTPMHVSAAMASTVNGGLWVEPTFAARAQDTHTTPQALSVMSEKTSETMRGLLRLVVTDGTGKNAEATGFRVGGKTGTAEKPGKIKKGYDRKRLISSFVGAFPMDDPQYVVFVALDEPKGNKATYGYATAGWVAAPVVSKVITSMASILGIMPDKENQGEDALSSPLKKYVSLKNG